MSRNCSTRPIWYRGHIGDEGILLRVDLHRMIDRGVAEIRNGRFRLLRQVLDYEAYDGVKVRKPKGREAG